MLNIRLNINASTLQYLAVISIFLHSLKQFNSLFYHLNSSAAISPKKAVAETKVSSLKSKWES
jgi:hypothetical protein